MEVLKMNGFYVVRASKLKQYMFIALAALFCALILFVNNEGTTSVFQTSNGTKVFYKGDTNDKNVSLTFDVTWGDSKLEKILETLANENVSNATFFVSGAWAERHPDLFKKIVDSKHEIGSLGYFYKPYTKLSRVEMVRDLGRAEEVFKRLGYEKVRLFRPPLGLYNSDVIDISAQFNYTVVHWSVDSQDWLNPGVNKIVNNVVGNLDKGDVIYFHASDSALQTEKALPVVIKSLRSKGYSNLNITDLSSFSVPKSSEIK
jgi:polysaccharide deacetylase family sporulation protein PdaB